MSSKDLDRGQDVHMSGPEHYRKGEMYLATSEESALEGTRESAWVAERLLALANAHFLAASVALAALPQAGAYWGDEDVYLRVQRAWAVLS